MTTEQRNALLAELRAGFEMGSHRAPSWADVAFLLAELDAARAREQGALDALKLAVVTEDRCKAAEAREAKLREAAQYYMSQFGQALEAHGIPYEAAQSEADSALRAALAEGEDTPPVCDCNGGEQGDGLCALPHEPTCASLKREDTRG